MTTDNYITIILWVLGGLTLLLCSIVVMVFNLRAGQDVTHLRLKHIEETNSEFKTAYIKLTTIFETSHTEITTIGAKLENLKSDVEKWEIRNR